MAYIPYKIKQLMQSPYYTATRHPDGKVVRAALDNYFAATYPNEDKSEPVNTTKERIADQIWKKYNIAENDKGDIIIVRAEEGGDDRTDGMIKVSAHTRQTKDGPIEVSEHYRSAPPSLDCNLKVDNDQNIDVIGRATARDTIRLAKTSVYAKQIAQAVVAQFMKGKQTVADRIAELNRSRQRFGA